MQFLIAMRRTTRPDGGARPPPGPSMATVNRDVLPSARDRSEKQVESASKVADALFRAEIENQPERPGATYRLQLHKDFKLDDVSAILDDLHAIGITDVYLSPFLSSKPGSTHGYDVFDHRRINPEVGDREAHERLVQELAKRGMRRVLDIVPNHMGVAGLNPYWQDVLETGAQSRSARYFDIDWHSEDKELDGRVLLPILEDAYGKVLEAGKLMLEREGGRLVIRYHDLLLPLDPRSYSLILGARANVLRERFDAEDEDVQEYRSIASSSRCLPRRDNMSVEAIDHVQTEKDVIKRRLHRLLDESPRIRDFLDETIAELAGTPGGPRSFDALHKVLEAQVYRLAFWRIAAENINYRRFFDINDLAGIRTEDIRVFEETHARIIQWVGEGGVSALRIDHPDGLADPTGYFRRLQERLFLRACYLRFQSEGHDVDWRPVGRKLREMFRQVIEERPMSPEARRFPIVAEKILSRGEALPSNWTIDGTVGYEFLNALNGLYVRPESRDAIRAIYSEFTGDAESIERVLHESKALIAGSSLASEVNLLARRLSRIAASDRNSRDFTKRDLRRAIRATLATFPIYRTYIQPGQPVSEADARTIRSALIRARRRNRSIDPGVFDFLHDLLLRNFPEGLSEEDIARRDAFVSRFQQTTGPVQAKGLEDTTFYRSVALTSINEVGGDPKRFGNDPEFFHRLNLHRLDQWPGSFSTTATHDTKRGEDVRARINVLSELPEDWNMHLQIWRGIAGSAKVERPGGSPIPDAREEYLFYQTLLGAWPFDAPAEVSPEGLVERIQQYLTKAIREAKLNATWTDEDSTYTDGVNQFVGNMLEGETSKVFLPAFRPFQERIARVGLVNSLSQTLLKLASPGVPDIYQGSDLWDLRLVDPDNRQPVDYEFRHNLRTRIEDRIASAPSREQVVAELRDQPADGGIKLLVIAEMLKHRRENAALYQQDDYLPVEAEGDRAGSVIGFLRRHEARATLTLAARLVAGMMGPDGTISPTGEAWSGTRASLAGELAGRRWTDLLTGRVVTDVTDLAEVFRVLPIAHLVS